MLEVKRSKNEPAANLIKRFTRKMQESGDLLRLRGLQFKTRAKSEVKKKKEAIKRARKKTRMEYLRKLGKIK